MDHAITFVLNPEFEHVDLEMLRTSLTQVLSLHGYNTEADVLVDTDQKARVIHVYGIDPMLDEQAEIRWVLAERFNAVIGGEGRLFQAIQFHAEAYEE